MVAAAQDRYPPKKHKGNKAKRRRPHDGPNPTTKKQRSEPWVYVGMCRTHWRFRDEAKKCSSQPCSCKGGN